MVLSVDLRVTCTTSLLIYCGFVSIPTSYVHYVTYHIVVLSVYLLVTCTTSLLRYCGFVSIPTSYVQYVTFNILWFFQCTYELRSLCHFYHTVDLPVYVRVTCNISLLTYCGFVSIHTTSYVHYVTLNILWLCQYNYQLRTLRHF